MITVLFLLMHIDSEIAYFFFIIIISHSFQELFRDMSDDLDVSESVDIN